ncbi:MAG: hypothetical protein ACRD0U_12095, partial [Acidimicrobiales bacterium]
PVAAACDGEWLPHPNPDLSLRFTPGPAASRDVVSVGRLVRVAAGLAVVAVEVAVDGVTTAAGVATSMVLAGRGRS